MGKDKSQVIPLNHLALIPDGDRRWAKQNGLPAWEGHRRGANNIMNMLEVCKKNEIHYMSMWGFSTENWKRSEEEVKHLMDIFRDFTRNKRKDLIKNKIRFKHIGRRDRLADDLLESLERLENDTKDFTEWIYIAGLDYSGEDEIIRATKKIIADVKSGKITEDDITTETYADYLDTAGIPNPDFFLRTSGEQRTSGFMLYQMKYTEYFFEPTLFPALTKDRLQEIIDDYYNRQRRFGGG